jgi:hypothetical protein
LSAEINKHILTWTIHALDEDKELEQFFEAIPGFCNSDVVREHDPQRDFTKPDEQLAGKFSGFILRTLSSSMILDEDKKRRVIICAKAADAAYLSHSTMDILDCVFYYEELEDRLRSVDIWQSLTSTSGDQVFGLCSQGIIAGVVASVSERDERWEALAMDQLGEATFRKYQAHGNSVLLANLIHITRLLFYSYLELTDFKPTLPTILRFISNFDIENTHPGLQHDFCALWNEIIREVQSRGGGTSPMPYHFLLPILDLYIGLHQGNDAALTPFDPSTDPSCLLYNIPGHHSDSSRPDIPSSSSPGLVASDTPLPLPSTFATSISLPPPLDITEQSRESAMSVPDIATDALRLQVSPDTVSSSGDIDRPE